MFPVILMIFHQLSGNLPMLETETRAFRKRRFKLCAEASRGAGRHGWSHSFF